jgi:hypothetical protein
MLSASSVCKGCVGKISCMHQMLQMSMVTPLAFDGGSCDCLWWLISMGGLAGSVESAQQQIHGTVPVNANSDTCTMTNTDTCTMTNPAAWHMSLIVGTSAQLLTDTLHTLLDVSVEQNNVMHHISMYLQS